MRNPQELTEVSDWGERAQPTRSSLKDEVQVDYPLRGVRPRFFLSVISYNILLYCGMTTACENGEHNMLSRGDTP